jgi:hypothetical protein
VPGALAILDSLEAAWISNICHRQQQVEQFIEVAVLVRSKTIHELSYDRTLVVSPIKVRHQSVAPQARGQEGSQVGLVPERQQQRLFERMQDLLGASPFHHFSRSYGWSQAFGTLNSRFTLLSLIP